MKSLAAILVIALSITIVQPTVTETFLTRQKERANMSFNVFKKELNRYVNLTHDKALFIWHWVNKKANGIPTTKEDDAKAKRIIAIAGGAAIIVLGILTRLISQSIGKRQRAAQKITSMIPEPVGTNQTKYDNFLYAWQKGDLTTIDQKYPDLRDSVLRNKNNFVHFAIAYRLGLPTVKQLVEENKSLLDEQNSLGETPLHVAISSGQPDIVRYLIEKIPAGYEIYKKKDFTGMRPLEKARAIMPKETDIIKNIEKNTPEDSQYAIEFF